MARFMESAGGWFVDLVFRRGSPGIDDVNVLAAECFARAGDCLSGRLAIVVEDEVITAPVVNAPSFDRDAIVVSGDFTEEEATALAAELTADAVPRELAFALGPD